MLRYSIKSLGTKKMISLLFCLAVCATISISMLAINISNQIQDGFYQADKKYDLILGPNGSDTQLVLSSLFFSDAPLGTVSSHYLEKLEQAYELDTIIPLAMADSYKGSAIIGTTTELLADYRLSSGALFVQHYEMVIGSNVASRYGLTVGDTIVTSHGTQAFAEQHDHAPYTIVGILAPTNSAYDNQCFTSVESVWQAHDHGDTHTEEIDALPDTDHADEADHDHANEHSDETDYNHANEHSDETDHDHANEHSDEADHDHDHDYTALLIKTGNMATATKLQTDFSEDPTIQVVATTQVLRKLVGNVDKSKEVAFLLCGIIITLALLLTCIMSFFLLTYFKEDIGLLLFLGLPQRKIYTYLFSQLGILLVASTGISFAIRYYVLTLANTISSPMGIVLDRSRIYVQELQITGLYVGLILLSTCCFILFQLVERKTKS